MGDCTARIGIQITYQPGLVTVHLPFRGTMRAFTGASLRGVLNNAYWDLQKEDES